MKCRSIIKNECCFSSFFHLYYYKKRTADKRYVLYLNYSTVTLFAKFLG